MKTVIVVGGGASGMAAAFACAEKHKVILLEKNEKLGKKIYITGKGRCNLTNDQEMSVHMKNTVTNPRFLYSAYAAFSKEDVKALLNVYGCPVKTERGSRVFPVTDHASDVTKAWTEALKSRQVDIRLNTKVTGLIIEQGELKGVQTPGGPIAADACIIATGGLSYASTGSTGDGYRFAEAAGLAVKPCRASLVPLITQETWPFSLSGLTLKNISMKLKDPEKPKKPLYEDFGELLFTHFGVSGPVILSASAYATRPLSEGKILKLYIDMKPALSEKELDERILKDLEKYHNKSLKNALTDLMPQAMIPVIMNEAGLSEDKKANELRKEERQRLNYTLKNLELTITGTRGFNEAVITQGGIDVKEIDPSTMQSKKVKGLYFAGEVLDVDALTGGFNLQIAWSTGTLAGRSIE